jgi:hypothetical protein
MLSAGRMTLSAIAKLAPLLSVANRDAVLRRASCRSKREIEELVAELAPRPDVTTSIRKLPDRAGGSPLPVGQVPGLSPPCQPSVQPAVQGGSVLEAPSTRAGGPPHPASIDAIAAGRYKVQLTIDRTLRDKLERLRALLPDEGLVEVLDRAVTETLQRLEARRLGSPRTGPVPEDLHPSARHIPAAVRRAVHDRDGGGCRFTNARGERCRARERLEFHHVRPWAVGGERSVANIRLMCRAHNALLTEHDFGAKRMSVFRRATREAPARDLEPP